MQKPDDQHHRCGRLHRAAESQAVVVRERRQAHPVHRLGEEHAREEQAQREAERQARARPEPEFGRQVGVSEGGVGIDGRAHQRAADQHQRQHAAADEEIGAVACYSFRNQEADEDDDGDADSDTEKNHGEPPVRGGASRVFVPPWSGRPRRRPPASLGPDPANRRNPRRAPQVNVSRSARQTPSGYGGLRAVLTARCIFGWRVRRSLPR